MYNKLHDAPEPDDGMDLFSFAAKQENKEKEEHKEPIPAPPPAPVPEDTDKETATAFFAEKQPQEIIHEPKEQIVIPPKEREKPPKRRPRHQGPVSVFAPSTDALQSMNETPHKKRSLLFIASSSLILLLLVTAFLIHKGRQAQTDQLEDTTEQSTIQLTDTGTEQTGSTLTPTKKPEPLTLTYNPSIIRTSDIMIPGTTVTKRGNHIVVRFDEGLFTKGYDLSAQAKVLLRRLGRKIKPHTKDHSIKITGYTDDDPIRKNSQYKSNHHLGLMRARSVLLFLQSDLGLPASAFQLDSKGADDPPYPNNSKENKQRNRTVVIELVPKKA